MGMSRGTCTLSQKRSSRKFFLTTAKTHDKWCGFKKEVLRMRLNADLICVLVFLFIEPVSIIFDQNWIFFLLQAYQTEGFILRLVAVN